MNLPLAAVRLLLLSMSVLFTLAFAGCSAAGGGNVKPPRDCPVHHVPLVKVSGFVRRGERAYAAWNYVRFLSEAGAKYPHLWPYNVGRKAESGYARISVRACPKCDSSFETDYAAYLKLSEEAKEARFVAVLKKTKLP
jgi:hypothetical protein